MHEIMSFMVIEQATIHFFMNENNFTENKRTYVEKQIVLSIFKYSSAQFFTFSLRLAKLDTIKIICYIDFIFLLLIVKEILFFWKMTSRKLIDI